MKVYQLAKKQIKSMPECTVTDCLVYLIYRCQINRIGRWTL